MTIQLQSITNVVEHVKAFHTNETYESKDVVAKVLYNVTTWMKTLYIPEPYILQCDNNSKKKGGDGQRGGRKGEKNRDEEKKEHKEDKKIGDKDLSSINQAGLKPSEWLSRDYKPKIKDKKYGRLCWRQNLS